MMRGLKELVLCSLALCISITIAEQLPEPAHSPVVDLGYARHQASYNATTDIYVFRNIRFADPPLGKRRFQPPQPVSGVDRRINNGSHGFKCIQAFPKWYLQPMANTSGIDVDKLRDNLLLDATMSEDCLFLDVLVPGSSHPQHIGCTSSESGDNLLSRRKLPVMVWIYGGGYVFGQKDAASFDATGLIHQSQKQGSSEPILYVALNYRLGLFGWLNGMGDSSVFPNVGLQDQRLALQWVKKYIHLFGGDPDRVTVFGESAGGGSIMHQITGNGGKAKAPFDRALIQSPGWLTSLPIADIWKRTLAAAQDAGHGSVSNGADLAKVDSKTLIRANGKVVYEANYGDFGYGPTVDGDFVPEMPGVSLLHGNFDPSIELMIGHNSHESDIFTSPSIDSEEKIVAKLRSSISGIKESALDYILANLYPPPSQTDLYDSQYARAALLLSEYTFVCNTRYLALAFHNETWNYRFQVPPGYHAQDLAYTFFVDIGNTSTSVNVTRTLALQMQAYFTKFSATGDPNKPHCFPKWQKYGTGSQIATFDTTGVKDATDDARSRRCTYWQQGSYI